MDEKLEDLSTGRVSNVVNIETRLSNYWFSSSNELLNGSLFPHVIVVPLPVGIHHEPSVQGTRRIISLQTFDPDRTLHLVSLLFAFAEKAQETNFQAGQTSVGIVGEEALE